MYSIRPLKTADRQTVVNILMATQMFTAEEIAVALELIDIFLNNPHQQDYIVEVAVNSADEPVGYVCYGPTPATEGTFDLYWIAVDPQKQGQGIGRLLLEHVEQKLIAAHARLLIIETSSTQRYHSTQQFYLKNHYSISARIKDFYRPGDDRLIFTKYLSQ